MSDLHPDQLDVPEQRPPADQSDAQSFDTNAPSNQPTGASKEVHLVKGTLPDFDRELFELLRPEDRLKAYKYHRDTQPIEGLSAQEEREYREGVSRRDHRYQLAHLVAIPAIGFCSSVTTAIAMRVHHVSTPWAIGTGLAAAGGTTGLSFLISKRRVARKRKQTELSAATTATEQPPSPKD